MKLIDDWKKGIKLHSIQLQLGNLTFNVVMAGITKGAALAGPLFGVIPGHWVFWLGALVAAGTIVVRLVQQKPKIPGG
jgi:hypothetical protein